MCTVSVVRRERGIRLVCNRDERITRSDALPPRRLRLGDTTAMCPIDPDGGGSWVGVNDARLAVVLLNRSVTDAGVRLSRRSRGEVVVQLLHTETLARAEDAIRGLDISAYEPFQLLIVQGRWIVGAQSDARSVHITRRVIDPPLMFTSSSLGDAMVDRVRRPLFYGMVCYAADQLTGQRLFHDHQWPSAPSVSVRMQRPDARTVSRTAIDLSDEDVSLEYEPLNSP